MHHQTMPGQCHAPINRRPIVCPMQHCVMDNYFVENQDIIHPTHLLVRNNHLLNNYNYFPLLVSEQNNFQTQEYNFPQGQSPDYNWMEFMSPQDMGQMPMMGEGDTEGQMPMMPQQGMMGEGQMPMMPQQGMMGEGQMPMMPQQGMMGGGQMPMMPQQGMMGGGQMPMMPQQGMMGQGQMPMMPQGQMPMGQMPGSDS
ncbi:CotD family spore coat protein [Halobacillus mangrovi]|uniref:CotD family spore coat protein n=1 Tax=Halobacillus mangrovi TaxID=402384 RepID=UPI003D963DA7